MTYRDDAIRLIRHHHADPADGHSIGRPLSGHAGWFGAAEVWIGEGPRYPGHPNAGHEQRLYWRPAQLSGDGGFVPGTGSGARIQPDMLGAFAGLASAKVEATASFARRFGVLRVCEHRLPMSHSDACRFTGDPSAEGWWEPIDVWREWSGRARALLLIVANHRAGRLGDLEDWRAVKGLDDPSGEYRLIEYGSDGVGTERRDRDAWQRLNRRVWWRDAPASSGLDAIVIEQQEVASQVERWLALGGVRFGIRAGATGYESTTAAEGLFGALGLQLLLVLARSDGLAFCKGCSLPFTPNTAHRRYCIDCGEAAGDEERRARTRERKRRSRARAASLA